MNDRPLTLAAIAFGVAVAVYVGLNLVWPFQAAKPEAAPGATVDSVFASDIAGTEVAGLTEVPQEPAASPPVDVVLEATQPTSPSAAPVPTTEAVAAVEPPSPAPPSPAPAPAPPAVPSLASAGPDPFARGTGQLAPTPPPAARPQVAIPAAPAAQAAAPTPALPAAPAPAAGIELAQADPFGAGTGRPVVAPPAAPAAKPEAPPALPQTKPQTPDKPAVAAKADKPAPPPKPVAKKKPEAARSVAKAPEPVRKAVPPRADLIVQWWPRQPTAGRLNLLYAGQATNTHSMALLFDSTLRDSAAASRQLRVIDSAGKFLKGNWELNSNRRMLLFKNLTPGRYTVVLMPELANEAGKPLGTILRGPVYIR